MIYILVVLGTTHRKHTNEQVRGSGDNLEDPGDEGYDPDGKDGAILMDLCEEDQNK